MKLYLIRTAQSEPGGFAEPLSRDGVTQAEKLGAMLTRVISSPETSWVLTSDWQRTTETAHIISDIIFSNQRGVTPGRPPAQRQIYYRPRLTDPKLTEPEQLLTYLRTIASEQRPKDLIAVWHLPALRAALNLLLGNEFFEWPNNNKYGATAHVACPLSLEDGTGKLRWFILPELLS